MKAARLESALMRGFVLAIISSVLVKPIWLLVIEPIVQNRVGSAMYGLYFALWNLAFLFRLMAEWGTNTVVGRLTAQGQMTRSWWRRLWLFRLAMAGLYFFLILAIGYLLGYRGSSLWWLAGLALLHVLMLLFLLLKSVVEGLQAFTLSGLVSSLPRLLMVLLAAFWLWAFPTTIPGFIGLQILAYALAIILLFQWVGRHSFPTGRPVSWLQLWKQAWPYALVGFLMTLYTRIDGVMLERLHPQGAWQAGLYAGGYRFVDALWMYTYTGVVMLLAAFAHHAREPVMLYRLMRWGIRILALPVFAAAVGLWVYRTEVLNLFYRDGAFMEPSFTVLLPAAVLGAFGYVYSTYMTALGQMRWLNLFALLTIVANVLLNWWLIPNLGAVGAAYATVIAQALFAMLCGFKALWIDGIARFLDWRDELRAVLWALAVLVWAALVPFFPLPWWVDLLIYLTGSGLLLIGLGVVSVNDLQAFFRLAREKS